MSEVVVDRTRPVGPLAWTWTGRYRGANFPADKRNLGARPAEAPAFDFKRSVGGRTSDGVHAGAIDARSLGARPGGLKRSSPSRNNEARTPSAVNQPVVDARSSNARIERPQGSFSIRSVGTGADRQSAIDARSLGARPGESKRSFPTRNVEARTSDGANQPAINARSLGAGINEAQRPFTRKKEWNSPLDRQDSSGRSIFQSRYPRGGDDDQSHPSTDMGAFQQRSFGEKNRSPQLPRQKDPTRYTGAGAQKAPQAYQTRSPRSQNSFQGRAMGGEGRSAQPRRSRPGRPRAARGSDDSERQGRKSGAEQRFDLSNRHYLKEGSWTAEERQYLEEKKERESESKVQLHEPEKVSKEIFIRTAPATASDELGLSNMLGERLLLATKYLDREFIQWDSKEQKADVMAVVEKVKAVRRGGNVVKTESASLKSANGDQQAQSLMQKLIAGEYAAFRRLGKNDILGQVERHVHRNDSFFPEDEKSLLEKVRSIMPAGRGLKVGGRARNEAKA